LILIHKPVFNTYLTEFNLILHLILLINFVSENGRQQRRRSDAIRVFGGLSSRSGYFNQHGCSRHCLLTLTASAIHTMDLKGSLD